jgi:putative PIN family toxin of toxin-antitoxin system
LTEVLSLAALWIVVDTSVWVSALITPSGPPGRILQAFFAGRVQVVVSDFLLAELELVLSRSRIRRRFTDENDAERLLSLLRSAGRFVTTTGAMHLCRDRKDDRVVETAIVGLAAYLVSRDEDLTRDLDLVRVLQAHGVEVLTVARFLELLDAEPV